MPKPPTNWIPKEDCRDRFLYRIHSRNLEFGVFRAATGGFIGLRTKFRSVYAFEEYHWDNGPPYGTVRPYELLEELPAEIKLDTSLGSVCGNCDRACNYVLFPDGSREKAYKTSEGQTYTMTVPGEWKHDEPGECQDVKAYNQHNQPLEKWLHEMEAKYGSG
jgi:hypothetical protein